MAEKYIISVDQSTQGTKALLFDESGDLIREQINLMNRLSMIKGGCRTTLQRFIRIQLKL